MNMDDVKLQLYIDGELDQKETKEVEDWLWFLYFKPNYEASPSNLFSSAIQHASV